MRFGLRTVAIGLMLLSAGAGCKSTPEKVDVTGKLVKDGQPLKVSDKGRIQIRLFTEGVEEEQTRSFTGHYDQSDGSFSVKAIFVGKYRVTVEEFDPYPGTKDKLNYAFNRKNSQIFREVNANGQTLETIDLAKEKSGPGS